MEENKRSSDDVKSMKRESLRMKNQLKKDERKLEDDKKQVENYDSKVKEREGDHIEEKAKRLLKIKEIKERQENIVAQILGGDLSDDLNKLENKMKKLNKTTMSDEEMRIMEIAAFVNKKFFPHIIEDESKLKLIQEKIKSLPIDN